MHINLYKNIAEGILSNKQDDICIVTEEDINQLKNDIEYNKKITNGQILNGINIYVYLLL